jgi:RNA polymerase sigma factor (sigma-70 family)
MEDWAVELQNGRGEAAWDLFIARYRRVIFAAIRRYAKDYDEVMDVFASVCEALRQDDLRRLRSYVDQTAHRARFSTWLVAVVRNLTIDWFRHRDGRKRLQAISEELPEFQRRIYEHVVLEGRSHVEAYELIRSRDGTAPGFGKFLAELRSMYQTVGASRRGVVLRELTVPPPEDVPDASAALEEIQSEALLARALETLNVEDRVALQLYLIDGLSAPDVGRVLGVTTKAVYNRVYRALASVREQLEGAGLSRGDL